MPIEAIDPVYFDKAYYLAPDKGGAKPYALLAKALRESKRCALGRWAARGKQYIVMIRPVEDGLVMQQLLYADEVRSIKDIEIPKTEVKDAELKLAQQLIEQQASDTFDPSAYTDEVRARIEAAVQKKVEGQEITHGRGARRRRRAGHRPDGSAAREPREEGAAARKAQPSRSADTRKPPKRAQQAEPRRARKAPRNSASAGRRAMHQYGVRDVEKLLRLPRSTIRALIAAGFVAPARGPRNAWLFSFQDLIVLRTAQALAAANVPQRRITRSMRELRRQLPDAMPLSGLSIGAVADRVVVSEGGSRWQAESGQYLLAFEGDPADGSLSVIERERRRQPPAATREDWFDKGVALEQRGRRGRDRRVRAAPSPRTRRSSMRASTWGGCCTKPGASRKAERVYRDAIKACGSDAVLLYNLGVLLDDMDRKPRSDGGVRGGAARRSRLRRLPLQPGAAVRRARAAEGSDPPHGAVSQADGGQVGVRRDGNPAIRGHTV